MPFIVRPFLAGTVALILIFGCVNEKDNSDAAGRAPRFSLKNLRGQTLHLTDLRGKVVVLNFFATWCAPCRREVQDLVRLYKKFNDNGLEIVGISLDMEGASLLSSFVKYYGITYPVVLGTREVVVDYGGIRGIPTTFLIDRQGIIAKHFVGLYPPHILEKSVSTLLREEG